MARPTDQALVSDQAASRLDPPGFDPSRVDFPSLGGGITPTKWLRSIATADRKIHAYARAREGEAIADWIEMLLERLAAVRLVIERGYPDKGLRHGQKCEHGRFGFEDCMGCYDEALWAALGCDSDGSPEGGDACGSVHDSAGRQASPETGSA